MTLTLAALLICHAGGPGTAAQAQPVVNKFMRHMEKTAGWKANSLTGAYRTSIAACQRYMTQKKPKIVVVDLATFLSQRAAWKLVPRAHMGTARAKRYHLLVRAGSYSSIAALKGKKLVTTISDPRFLSKIVLGGKVDASKHFVIKRVRRPLKGLRRVARSRADATIVDELAYRYLKELKLPVKLVSIYSSGHLPGLTLALSKHAGAGSADLARRITRTLPKLCAGAGKELCKTFQIRTFGKAKTALYRKLSRGYGR